jgi:hypothetical protein
MEDLPQTSQQLLNLIVGAERHRKFVWTAGRVLREAALWKEVENLDYRERKAILQRLTGLLEQLADEGVLERRRELQSIGYGSEMGFDYLQNNTTSAERDDLD